MLTRLSWGMLKSEDAAFLATGDRRQLRATRDTNVQFRGARISTPTASLPAAAWIPQPTDRHVDFLDILLALPGVHANLVPDAHLAALALEHGLTLCSTDGDFARFPSLRYLNPLAP